MKTMKKTLALILAAIMALSMFGVAAFADPDPDPELEFVKLPVDIVGLYTGDRWFDAYKLCRDYPDRYYVGSGYAEGDDFFTYYVSTDGTALKIVCEDYP